jgi:hypothetical protein
MISVSEWALKHIICLKEVLKNDFGKDDEAVFECIERHFPKPHHRKNTIKWNRLSDFYLHELACDHIICLLDVLKKDFVEVDEAIFQGLERPCILTFFILGIQKSYLFEVSDMMF